MEVKMHKMKPKENPQRIIRVSDSLHLYKQMGVEGSGWSSAEKIHLRYADQIEKCTRGQWR